MLVSPILNDLLDMLKFDVEEFLDETLKAIEVDGEWHMGADRRASGISSVIVRLRSDDSIVVDVQLSGVTSVTHFADVGSLTAKGLPETVLNAINGLRIGSVVDHPLLARDVYAITKARSVADGRFCVIDFTAVREELSRRRDT